jgi:predicted lipoprotein with Yx(FWY)xxD motif
VATHSTRRTRALTVAAALALLAAGCGGGYTTSSAASSSTGASASSGPSTSTGAVGTGSVALTTRGGTLGSHLTDTAGRTLYLFDKDTGPTSTCYGQCAAFWPPLLTGNPPTAGTGTRTALLGTTKRTDGGRQVTYAGHPLYYFAQDRAAGDIRGQGLNVNGGLWWGVAPSGASIISTRPATPPPSSSTSTTSSGGDPVPNGY